MIGHEKRDLGEKKHTLKTAWLCPWDRVSAGTINRIKGTGNMISRETRPEIHHF